VMPTGPKRPFPAQMSRPGSNRVIRGQLARLIRERPVFVNVAGRRNSGLWNCHNQREYICPDGVFQRARVAARSVAD
jgi:hypothetical protein